MNSTKEETADQTDTVAEHINDITIDAVFFAQTHVLEPHHPYFCLVGEKDTLVKVHVLSRTGAKAPAVTIALHVDETSETMDLSGPEVLPESFNNEPGQVVHCFDDCFTAIIPGRWIRKGLKVVVTAGDAERTIDEVKVGSRIDLKMTMIDIHYFDYEDVDYPENWEEEIALKRPVTTFEVERLRRVLFPEVVIRPLGGLPAVRCRSEEEYLEKTGKPFHGQMTALLWQCALQKAGGQQHLSLFFVNIANTHAGGFAEHFGGCGTMRRFPVLHHELAHALDVEDLCGAEEPLFPYRNTMHGIDKTTRGGYHIGPTWGYDPRPGLPGAAEGMPCFINPVNPCEIKGEVAGEWRSSPVRGGGGPSSDGHPLTMFSDWSVRKMQAYLENRIVLWDDEEQTYRGYVKWFEDHRKKLTNDGIKHPIERNVEVYSIMVSVSAVTEEANFIYPVIGPYRSGLIRTFDPTREDDRVQARKLRDGIGQWDLSLRVEQGGKARTYMLQAFWSLEDDPLDLVSYQTHALNVPVRDGEVTRVELLLTPEAHINGLPDNPKVLYARNFAQ